MGSKIHRSPRFAAMVARLRMLRGNQMPYVLAHRGNQVLCPENTLAAFAQAVVDGADILETDIQLTLDTEFICIHDDTVDRTTDGTGPVDRIKLDEIRGLSASYGMAQFAEERIPTLDELIDWLPDSIGLALELKSRRFFEAEVCREFLGGLKRSNVYDRTIVISFRLDHLKTIRSLDSEIPLGYVSRFALWPFAGVDFLGTWWPFLVYNPSYALIARRHGQWICPLDPVPEARLQIYRRLGCQSVLTNNPEATCRALNRGKTADPHKP